MTTIVKKNIPKNSRLNNSGGDVIINNYGGNSSDIKVIDNLNSNSTVSALSANQGKILNDKISNIDTNFDEKYLSKTKDDTASGRITFNQGLTSNGDVYIGGADKDINNGAAIYQDEQNGGYYIIEADGIKSRYWIEGDDYTVNSTLSSPEYSKDTKGFKLYKDASKWNLEIDNIDVRGRLDVKTLQIEESKYIGGKLYCTLAGLTISNVVDYPNYYKCEFLDTLDGVTINNKFAANDLAFCQTFNNNQVKRYWRKVLGIGSNFINLSKTECESNSDVPEVGDDVVLLGNLRDRRRQGALVIAPNSLEVYEDIKTFELPEPKIILSPNNTKINAEAINFLGQTIINNNFKVDNQGNIELNGTIRAEKGYFRGFLEKGITEITPENITQYMYFDDQSRTFEFYLDKISPVIIFKGDFNTARVPMSWENAQWLTNTVFNLPSIYSTSGYNHLDTVEKARHFLNIDICVYNMSTNYVPKFVGSFLNDLNPEGKDEKKTVTCNINKMYYLHSHMRIYSGKENIYWTSISGNYEIGYN